MTYLAAFLALAVAAATTRAQSQAYDPDLLPAYYGELQLFTLTPRGDIDGIVLTTGVEVKTPPPLSAEIAVILRPGDRVTIHGLKAAKAPLIQAVSVTNDRDGKSVADRGLPPPPAEAAGKVERRTVTGRVRMALHGPRGDVDGALLDDGLILRLPPPAVERFASLLAPGSLIAAEGATRVTSAGAVLAVRSLGASSDRLQPLD